MPSPPSTIKGEVKVTTKASYHEKIKQIKHEKKSPSPASVAIANDSVVKPLTALISSVKMLVRMPGARFLLSNHSIGLCNNDSKSLTLNA